MSTKIEIEAFKCTVCEKVKATDLFPVKSKDVCKACKKSKAEPRTEPKSEPKPVKSSPPDVSKRSEAKESLIENFNKLMTGTTTKTAVIEFMAEFASYFAAKK